MATITIMDPVTRIEGHLKVEVTIDQNRVTDAKCTGTLFRGFEKILAGRHPWDAPILTQRICGVCPISHGLAASMALDNASGRSVPDNGRILRNLTLGSNYVQSHILHFYLLSLLDYVAGPQTSPWTPAYNVDMRFPASNPTYPIMDHFVQAVAARRRAHEMGALLSGRMPITAAIISGGHTVVPNAAMITKFRTQLNLLLDFIRNIYIPDSIALSQIYSDYFNIGGGWKNLLAYGVFDLNASGTDKLFHRGCVENATKGNPNNVFLNQITESVTHSWYADATNNLTPRSGDTQPVYPKTNGYSWLKAPRHQGKPFETGALARMWVTGDYQNGVSVMDRHLARAQETLKVAEAMLTWLDQLTMGAPSYEQNNLLSDGEGIGLTEAPRGALGHWVKIAGGTIAHYQVITPTCWNASPQDDKNVRGPIEQALVGTPVMDPTQPIEVLRVIHSFDPCLSCAVHVMRPKEEPMVLEVPAVTC
ncbi:MAG: nickel-dependent hydrogenase large subunit [Candidatus Omnitrophica bacterium]|nr:nickel-dependent hydrogenase large subunit [Candidatus Omnitrophota bacterium]